MEQTAQQPEWLDYRVAEQMLLCPKTYLRRRNADGSFEYYPEIRRCQPRGRGTQLFVWREDVEAWIEANLTPEPAPIKQEFSGHTYQSAVRALLEIKGGEHVVRALKLNR